MEYLFDYSINVKVIKKLWDSVIIVSIFFHYHITARFGLCLWNWILTSEVRVWIALSQRKREHVQAPLIQLLPALPLSHLSETDTQRHFNPVFAHSNPSDGCIIAKYVRHKMQSQLGLHLREPWQNSSVACQETTAWTVAILSNTISWRKPSGHGYDTSPHSTVSNTVNQLYLTC